MKRRVAFVVLVVLAGSIGIGCGGRVDVVKDKILGQIDSLLGKMDVERKQIDIAMKGLGTGIDGIRKAKIKAKVKRDQIKDEVTGVESQIAKVDSVLKVIRPHLEAKDPVEIAGTKYTPAQVKETATKLLAERKQLSDKLVAIKTVETSLDQTATALENQQTGYQQKLQKLETQVTQLDAQGVALKAKREAATAMAVGDDSMSSSVKSLQDKVNGLLAETTADFQLENEKWNEAASNKDLDSLDATLAKFKSSNETGSEIDKILGTTKK